MAKIGENVPAAGVGPESISEPLASAVLLSSVFSKRTQGGSEWTR